MDLPEPLTASSTATRFGSDARSPFLTPHRAEAVTAFIGRTLRGPVNVPVTVQSLADYQQVFGGLWQPSPLSYAVEQYFEHGGRRAVVVRVANRVRPPTVVLRCGAERLRLVALAPGTREFLRVAVDYDNLPAEHRDRFNLTVQRVRSPHSERIEAQESFRGVSIRPGTSRCLADMLLQSQLIRVRGALPATRPDATGSAGNGYAASGPDGDDGGPVTDYDIIGSARDRTGLFALDTVQPLDFLYIPPLARDTDIGASSVLVAARYCRTRRALLVLDPPVAWTHPAEALRGIRELQLASSDACMFFPRVRAADPLRGTHELFGNGGAVAGLLTRTAGATWDLAAPEPELLLRPGYRPACALLEADRWRLAAHGINTLGAIRSPAPVRLLPRTLAGVANAQVDWSYLTARRLGLFIVERVDRGTRWLAMQADEPRAWRRARAEVLDFIEALASAGAFPGSAPRAPGFVVCDERTNPSDEVADGRVSLLFGFAAPQPGRYLAYQVTHSLHGSEVREVEPSWLADAAEFAAVETSLARSG